MKKLDFLLSAESPGIHNWTVEDAKKLAELPTDLKKNQLKKPREKIPSKITKGTTLGLEPWNLGGNTAAGLRTSEMK